MPIVVTTTSTGTYVDISELVRRVRILLEDYPQKDKLVNGAALTSTTGHFYVEDTGVWAKGVRGEFEDSAFEQFLVRDVAAYQSSIGVQRGVYGTTASAHDDGIYLLREPRFGGQQITDAITAALRWMSGWVWTNVQMSITPSTTNNYYSVPAALLGWVSLTQASSDAKSLTLYGVRHSGLPVKINRNVPTATSSTGVALWIPILANTSTTMLLTYGTTPTTSTITAGPMEEAAIYGACAVLLGAKDAPRTGQDISQGGGVTPAGATINTASWFLNEFTQYRREARKELEDAGTLHRF